MPNTAADEVWLHVVAAVIPDASGRHILLARRPYSKHQGGKWEFPGGKVENGESPQQALVRELNEEIGIRADPATLRPFIRIHHRYPEKNVFLDVWQVKAFTGQPRGLEGQETGWFAISSLSGLPFPDANAPIIDALQKAALD
ncbi:MAG: 8-oxo-dGTP diphosphatase MutT [Thiothrix sp.]|nr:8-oxo-dGTP diphosphatase MutT [Thiothrix sp.]HPQ97645.1 8-oxo-dGTP diphosphatase MutT [Thiolinea sp.]